MPMQCPFPMPLDYANSHRLRVMHFFLADRIIYDTSRFPLKGSSAMAVGAPVLGSVLITGGTGFVGSAIARALAERHPECSITVLDLKPPDTTHPLPTDVSFLKADITSLDDIRKVVQKVKPHVLFHTAGIVPVLGERYGRRLERLVRTVNVEGTRNALEAAKQAGVPAFIYTSTCCTITDDMEVPYANIDERWPTSPSSLMYGESKVGQHVAASFTTSMPLISGPLTGCCRSFGPRSVQQCHGDLRPPALGALRAWRQSISSTDSCVHRQGRDTVRDRRRFEFMGRYIRYKCR